LSEVPLKKFYALLLIQRLRNFSSACTKPGDFKVGVTVIFWL